MKIDIADIQIVRPELLKKGDVLMFRLTDWIDQRAGDHFRDTLYLSGVPESVRIVFAVGVDEIRIVSGEIAPSSGEDGR